MPRMRILDLFKGYGTKPARTLELDERTTQDWPQSLVAFLEIDKEFVAFSAKVEESAKAIDTLLRKFTDEDVLATIPERARTMCALHGHEYVSQTRKLLQAATFTDLFSFERQQDIYFEANSKYKDLTTKNTAALHEFFGEQLKATQERLEELEDLIIKMTGTLEERHFPQVRKVKDLQLRISQMKERGERYSQLLTSLEQDLQRTAEKRKKIDVDIKAQLALIRNEQALAALHKAERVEQELHDIAVKYASVCDDLRNIYKKNPNIRPGAKTKHAIDELPKDPLEMLAQESERITEAFEEAIAQLEEENPGNVKNLIVRLSKLAKEAETVGRRVATSIPDQRALKRDIMKDIAALQVYDKQQFYMRARTEEESITTKIAYIKAELDPDKIDAMRQEMKALVRDLGATIKDDPSSEIEGTKREDAKRHKDDEHKAPKVEIVDVENDDENNEDAKKDQKGRKR